MRGQNEMHAHMHTYTCRNLRGISEIDLIAYLIEMPEICPNYLSKGNLGIIRLNKQIESRITAPFTQRYA